MKKYTMALTASLVLTAGCIDKTIVSPENAATVDALAGSLTRGGVTTLALGVVAADRAFVRGDATYYQLSAIMARDAYRIEATEPRFVQLQRHTHDGGQCLAGEVILGRADAAGDDEHVAPPDRFEHRLFDGALVVGNGEVGRDVAADGGELLSDPGGVGVDGLPERELVADGEDDGFHRSLGARICSR